MTTTPLPPTRMTPWGKNRAAPVETANELPAQSDVVIIGAGANGIMTAWFLAQHGVSVTVCDKGEVAAESSSRAFGWISGLALHPSKMELSRQSLELWQQMQDEIGDLGFRREGLSYLAGNDDEMAFYEGWRDEVKDSGYPGIELLDADGVASRFPGLGRRMKGGILGSVDGGAEPKIAIPNVARAAMAKGVKIIQQCAVRGIETAAGRVSAVVTERGTIRTSAVLCAANFWSRLFCGSLGLNVPQLYAVMSMGATTPVANGPVGNGGQEHWAWRRQIDGGYSLGRLRGQHVPVTRDSIRLFSMFGPMMKLEAHNVRPSFGAMALQDLVRPRRWRLDAPGPFEKCRILDPGIDGRVPAHSLKLNREHFAAFNMAEMVETWAGAITITPDNVAIASAVDALPGFYLLTGCSYGLSWSPALGRMMAGMITGRAPDLDPRPYRLNRFFDGSPIEVKY